MANRRKSDLIDTFEELSEGYNPKFLSEILIPTGRSGQFASRDYIAASAILAELNKAGAVKEEITTKSDVKKFLHPTTLFRLNMYSPCLAYRYDELKEEEQKNLFNNDQWIFTEKENGCRVIVVSFKGVTKCFSRNYSVDGSLPEYWGNIFQTNTTDETFAFDAEIKYEPEAPLTEILEEYGVYTDSPLEAMASLLQMNEPQALAIQKAYREEFNKDLVVFRLITPLYYKGVDYRKLPIGAGFKIEEQFINAVKGFGFNIKPIRKIKGSRLEKELFLSKIIDVEHGEGVVAHNLLGKYSSSDNRDKNVFVKIKRSLSAQASKSGLGDTIDGFVTGYKLGTPGTGNENLVSALEFTVKILDEGGELRDHIISYTPNLDLELKKKITLFDEEGKAYLDPQVYGLVGSLSGQSISYRSQRITHPKLLEFPRFDKSKHDCLYSEQWIKSQIDYQAE